MSWNNIARHLDGRARENMVEVEQVIDPTFYLFVL